MIDESYLGAAALLMYIQLLASPFARAHSRIVVCKQSRTTFIQHPLASTPLYGNFPWLAASDAGASGFAESGEAPNCIESMKARNGVPSLST
jgi:hypothetical protein